MAYDNDGNWVDTYTDYNDYTPADDLQGWNDAGAAWQPDPGTEVGWTNPDGSTWDPMSSGSMGGVGGGNDYRWENNNGNASAGWLDNIFKLMGGGAGGGGATMTTNPPSTLTPPTGPGGTAVNPPPAVGGIGGSGGLGSIVDAVKPIIGAVAPILGAKQQVQANKDNSKEILDYLGRSIDRQDPGGASNVDPNSPRYSAQQGFYNRQNAYNNFMNNPNSDAGYKATNEQLEYALMAQNAMHGNRNNINAIAPSILAAKADNQMKYQKQYMSDLSNYAKWAGLENFYSGRSDDTVKEAIMLGNMGDSPYYAAINNILNTKQVPV